MYHVFSLLWSVLFVSYSTNHFQTSSYTYFFTVLSSRNSISVYYLFWVNFHNAQGVCWGSLFWICVPLVPGPSFERLSFLHWIVLEPLSKTVDLIDVDLFLSPLFCFTNLCLSFYQYHAVIIIYIYSTS